MHFVMNVSYPKSRIIHLIQRHRAKNDILTVGVGVGDGDDVKVMKLRDAELAKIGQHAMVVPGDLVHGMGIIGEGQAASELHEGLMDMDMDIHTSPV